MIPTTRMKKIAFLFGGRSAEHEVSVASAACLLPRLCQSEHEIIPIFIDRDGSLYRLLSPDALREDGVDTAFLVPTVLLYGGASLSFEGGDGTAIVPDLFFSVLHGSYGEDGAWQGLFKLSGIPFIGCDLLSSAISMNKAVAKELARAAHLPTAHWLSVRDAREGTLLSAEKLFSYPVFVKPAEGGSSFGAAKATDRASLKAALEEALRFGDEVLIEEYVDGREISVAILEKDGVFTVSPPGEIAVDGIFDYVKKYKSDSDTLICPAPLSKEESLWLTDAAKKLFRLFRCRHVARVDFFRTHDGRLLFNEINTIPGFTSHSLYTRLLSILGKDVLCLLSEVER